MSEIRSIGDARRRQPPGGRVPPQDLGAETALLGACLLSRDAIADAVEHVGADDFHKPAHGHIFEAIVTLYAAGDPVDPVTVADGLRRAGLLDAVGGPADLLGLQAATPATSNAARYARIVADTALLRRLVGVAGEIAEIGYSAPPDVAEALDAAEAALYRVAERRDTGAILDLRTMVERGLDHIEALYESGDRITGIPTGYVDLDDVLLGLQPGALYVVGARPSIGKTAWLLGAVMEAAKAGHRALVCSLEMSHLELALRLLSMDARVDLSRLRSGKLAQADWSKLSEAVGRLAGTPLFIDDNPRLTVLDLRAKARRMKSRDGVDLIAVDYIQLMADAAGAENRQVEVAAISRGLKVLAREIEVPVVALSQLSRQVEMRADKRPQLSDLRESGSIEQDADVVLGLYRDEVYNPDSADRGMAEVIVLKHRNGPTGKCRLSFLPHCARFVNMARF